MKVKTIVSALILSLAGIGAAQAQNKPFDGVYGKNYSKVTREQVMQDLKAARAAGWLTDNQDIDNQPFTPQKESDGGSAAVAATPETTTYHDPSGLAAVKFGDIDNVPFQGS